MKKWLIIDTETTGLGKQDEILEIAVVNAISGDVLFNRRCRPQFVDGWPAAEQVHGITRASVAGESYFDDLYYNAGLGDLLERADRLSAYNMAFDWRLIGQSLSYGGVPERPLDCLMLRYAAHERVLSTRGGWRWHKLRDAAAAAGHIWIGDAHSALTDALAARSVALMLGIP